MKKSIMTWGILFTLFASFLFVSCDNDDDDMEDNSMNIVEFAQNNPDYTILADAAVRAGLDDELSAPGNLTVFAPDNDAFTAFLSANNFANLDEVPVDVLEAVLLYHVLGGQLLSTELANSYITSSSPSGYDNAPLTMYVNIDSGIVINAQAEVVSADNEVSNGVIHGIDEVITLPDVVTLATADPAFTNLAGALTASQLNTDLVAALQAEGPFTVFAPTNQAFVDLLNSNDDWDNIADIPGDLLETVLLYHVTDAGNIRSNELAGDVPVNTLAGPSFTINAGLSPVTITAGGNTGELIFFDIQATNGVIHVVDSVLLPN